MLLRCSPNGSAMRLPKCTHHHVTDSEDTCIGASLIRVLQGMDGCHEHHAAALRLEGTTGPLNSGLVFARHVGGDELSPFAKHRESPPLPWTPPM